MVTKETVEQKCSLKTNNTKESRGFSPGWMKPTGASFEYGCLRYARLKNRI